MRVRITHRTPVHCDDGKPVANGQVCDVPKELARLLVDKGMAEIVRGRPRKKTLAAKAKRRRDSNGDSVPAAREQAVCEHDATEQTCDTEEQRAPVPPIG